MSFVAPSMLVATLLALSPMVRASELRTPPPPEGERAALERAQGLLSDGKFAEAEAALAGTQSTAARVQLAKALAWQGRPVESAALLRKVAAATGQAVDPHSSTWWVILAAEWKAPPAALAHHARGFWLSQLDRCAEARVELEAALELAPALADARYHLGYCLGQLGDRVGFEREIRAALAGYAPGERILRASAEYSLGNWLTTQGPEHAREALRLLEAAAGLEGVGRSPGVLLALGQAQAAMGELRASQATNAEIVERLERGEEPGFPANIASELRWSLYTWGCRRRPPGSQSGRPPECVTAAVRDRNRVGYDALNAGKVMEAEEPLRAAANAEPSYGMAWAWLGGALLRQGRASDAVPALEKAVANQGFLDAQGRADDLLNLAHALAKGRDAEERVEALSGEAARILDEEAARPNQEGSRRATLNLAIGRAFMLAGNGRCAAQRFEWVAKQADAPAQHQNLATEMLSSVKPLGDAGSARCFEYELYRPTTMKAEAARYLKEHPPEKVGDQSHRSFHPPERYRSRVRFTGQIRDLQPKRVALVNALYRPWELTRQIPDRPGGKALREVQVEEAGSLRWVPIQEALIEPIKSELGQGGGMDLYVMLLGDLDGAPTFIAGEFRATK